MGISRKLIQDKIHGTFRCLLFIMFVHPCLSSNHCLVCCVCYLGQLRVLLGTLLHVLFYSYLLILLMRHFIVVFMFI